MCLRKDTGSVPSLGKAERIGTDLCGVKSSVYEIYKKQVETKPHLFILGTVEV